MLRLFRRNESPRDTAQFEVSHQGEAYRIALKRVVGATRFTIRVRSATRDVVLTMPVRGSVTAARDFAERHADWIGARLRKLPKPVPFEAGEVIPFEGSPHRIVHAPMARGVVWIDRTADDEPAIYVAGDAHHLTRRIGDFLKRQAKKRLEAAVKSHTAKIGLLPRSVTVRDTTSRWGSCSASGSLNFSWRLIMAPPFVLDYLAAHEVAHLVHLNHSEKFWAVTRRLSDDTDAAEAWLKAHGATLHRYGHHARPART